jgi:hypothetical protein
VRPSLLRHRTRQTNLAGQLKSRRRDKSFATTTSSDSHPPWHHGKHQTRTSPLVLQVRTMHPCRTCSVPQGSHWDHLRHEDQQSQVVVSPPRAGSKRHIPTIHGTPPRAPSPRVRALARSRQRAQRNAWSPTTLPESQDPDSCAPHVKSHIPRSGAGPVQGESLRRRP